MPASTTITVQLESREVAGRGESRQSPDGGASHIPGRVVTNNLRLSLLFGFCSRGECHNFNISFMIRI